MELVLILDNIRSVYNVGSIFRTADAAGVKKIYLCGLTPSPIDRFGRVREDFFKVSLGAEKTVPWDASARSARTTLKLFEKLKKEGYKIFAVEQAKRSVSLNKLKKSQPKKIALVLGNEVDGVSKPALKIADEIIEIPMFGKKESLNVSVAAGIIVYFLKLR